VVYCEQCGAANDIMNQQCHRCGFQFVPVEPVPGERVHAAVAPVAVHNVNSIPDMESAAGLGAGLELPDWLQKAAAATPELPASQRPRSAEQPVLPKHQPPVPLTWSEPSFDQQPETARPVVGSANPVVPPKAEIPRPQAPSPTQAHSSTIPEWLRTGQPPILRPAQPEVTDTSSFISEGDLPEWIRQIGVADTAKRVEEERIAAELAKVYEEPVAGRTILPGETNLNGAASNPWLSRKEGSIASNAWAGNTMPAQTRPRVSTPENEDNERPEVVQVVPDETPVAAVTRSKRSMPSMKMPTISKPALPKLALNKGSAESGNPLMRYALMGAIALLLIVLLVLVVL